MKSSVRWIFILLPAFGTHFEITHGGMDPVIWIIQDQGKTWATVSAIDKRIFFPSAIAVQFSDAIIADRNVRTYFGNNIFRIYAGKNGKIIPAN